VISYRARWPSVIADIDSLDPQRKRLAKAC
jgi:hypothetical protein